MRTFLENILFNNPRTYFRRRPLPYYQWHIEYAYFVPHPVTLGGLNCLSWLGATPGTNPYRSPGTGSYIILADAPNPAYKFQGAVWIIRYGVQLSLYDASVFTSFLVWSFVF